MTVESCVSKSIVLMDMVFQGTVLGPTLWNAFFSDIADFVTDSRQQAQIFADDLNVVADYPAELSEPIVLEDLSEAQRKAHIWGRRNQVTFDPSKEHFHIVHPYRKESVTFRLLGSVIDEALSMRPLIDKLLNKLKPKVRALLRLQHVSSLRDLLNQFKAHVWSYLEYHNGAIIVAKRADRERLDRMQRSFLHQLGLTDEEAFVNFNFAPLSLRRSIGILGFLHKRILGTCHPTLVQVFPLAAPLLHNKTIDGSLLLQVRSHRALHARSIWPYIHIYNRLSQGMVDHRDMKSFQSHLT